MTLTYAPLWIDWQRLPIAVTSEGMRLRKILESWEGTPYAPGQCLKGKDGGVDCVHWVAAVITEYRGLPVSNLPKLPQDTAMHDPDKAWALKRTLRNMFDPFQEVNDCNAQSGDIVVSGPHMGGPGHTQFVGFQKNTLWHAISPCVCFTGWSMPSEYRIYRVLRLQELVG